MYRSFRRWIESGRFLSALDREEIQDFEDCLQDQCAQDIEAEYIVTCNIRDFSNSKIPAVTPMDFLKLVE